MKLRLPASRGWKRVIPIDAAAATVYVKSLGSVAPGSPGQQVAAIRIICETTEAADATNNAVYTVENSGTGLVLATFSNAAANLVANVPTTLTLTTTISQQMLAAGQSLLLRKVINGTGTLFGELLVEVDFHPVR